MKKSYTIKLQFKDTPRPVTMYDKQVEEYIVENRLPLDIDQDELAIHILSDENTKLVVNSRFTAICVEAL